MRDRDQPSSLDETPPEERFPFRHVALFCDRGCGTEIDVDIRANTAEQAYEGLRRIAVAEHGWSVTDDEDVCPDCHDRSPVMFARLPDGGFAAAMCPACDTLGGHDADCRLWLT